MARRRRVARIVETPGVHRRRILRGVRRHVHTRRSWSIFREQRARTGRPPRWPEDGDGDGIISRATPRQPAGFEHHEFMGSAFRREVGDPPGADRRMARK